MTCIFKYSSFFFPCVAIGKSKTLFFTRYAGKLEYYFYSKIYQFFYSKAMEHFNLKKISNLLFVNKCIYVITLTEYHIASTSLPKMNIFTKVYQFGENEFMLNCIYAISCCSCLLHCRAAPRYTPD